MKPFFQNARIISDGTDPAVYLATGGRRGQPDYVMSRGDLVEFSRCPSRWVRGYEGDGGSKATTWGSTIDALLLDPLNAGSRIAIYPETYPADGKKGETIEKPWSNNATFAKEWKKSHGDKLFLKQEEADEAQSAVGLIRSHADLAAMIDSGRKQVFVMAEYHDAAMDIVIPVKGMIDLVPEAHPFGKSLVDFKTCVSAGERDWQQAVYYRGYQVQAAMYLDLWNAATGEDRTDFLHILQENYPPYEVAKRILSAEYLELGRSKYQNALARYAECLKSGEWPSYDDCIQTPAIHGFRIVEPMPWMIMGDINEWHNPVSEMPDTPDPVAHERARQENEARINRERAAGLPL